MKWFFITIFLLATSCGGSSSNTATSPINISRSKEVWNNLNDPINLGEAYNTVFIALPLGGELSRKPWTDNYWPNYRGGIADRWRDPSNPSAFYYYLYKQEEIAAMPLDQLARLSPAEKYDIFNGRFDYPLVYHERSRTNPDDPGWYGLCHGWAPAAINFEEPNPITLSGPGMIEVPFGSSDIKALLTFAQQYGNNTHFLGTRCNYRPDQPEHANSPECRDTNAGSFHIVLTNQIALLNGSFVADMSRSDQVWNQPIYGYTTTINSSSNDVYPNAAPGTVSIISVTTVVRYISELSPSWDRMPFNLFPWQSREETLRYRLEIDGDGKIIGGEWDSEERPDFLWTEDPPDFRGFFGSIWDIYSASVAPQ